MFAHHDGSELHVCTLAPGLGDTVTVFVRVAGADRVHVRTTPDGERHFLEARVDRRTGAGVTWWRAQLVVRNPVTRYRFLLHGPGGPWWLHQLGRFGHACRTPPTSGWWRTTRRRTSWTAGG